MPQPWVLEALLPSFSTVESGQSSTAREVRGYAAAYRRPRKTFPTRSRKPLEGDNQGAISAVNHMRSPVPEINEVLKGVFQLCCQRRFDVLAKWIPREHLTEADALSRLPDPSDWGISASQLLQVIEHFKVKPTVDLFASDIHHVAQRFVSKFFQAGCCAVDAIRQDWGSITQASDVVWIFPPHRQVSLALSLLQSVKREALVCMPIKAGSNELIQLSQRFKMR
jgi:hypothetical protein